MSDPYNSQYQADQIHVQQIPLENPQQQQYNPQYQPQHQQFHQGIPMNQYQQPYPQQYPQQQFQPQYQQQTIAIVPIDIEHQKFAKIRHICYEYKKMCECWMYVLCFLVVITIINLAVGSGTYENSLFYVSEISSVLEFFIWLYGTYLGTRAIKFAQIDDILTGNKFIYASMPFQVCSSILKIYVYLIVEGEAFGMLFAVLILILEVYMGYYKIYKYIPLSREIHKILQLYQTQRTGNDPTLQQLLVGNVQLN